MSIFGASGGGGLSIATDNPDVAAEYVECLDRLCDQNETLTNARNLLLGLVGVYGVIRQQQALEDQIDLQERVVDQADDYLSLATRNYDEVTKANYEEVVRPTFEQITVPAFECQKDLFNRYEGDMRGYELRFLDDAFCEPKLYEPDFCAAQGRAMSTTQAQFDRARQDARRRRGKYASGACCSEEISFSIAAATARVGAANAAYRDEVRLKLELDQWYFRRRAAAAEFAANTRAQVISGVNGGIAAVNSGLSALNQSVSGAGAAIGAVGGAVNGLTSAARGLGDAFGAQGSAFASLSNGAFSFLGYQTTQQGGAFQGLGTVGGFGFNQSPVTAPQAGQFVNPGTYAPFESSNGGVLGGFSNPVSATSSNGFGVI